MGEGSANPTPGWTNPLPHAVVGRGGKEMADLPMTGATEPALAQDQVVTMEVIFRDLHLEGQQAVVASPGAT